MESIMLILKQRLRDAGPARWEPIALAAGVSKSLPRKLMYDADRTNPRVNTVQPLLDFFEAVDRGERPLPEPTAHVDPAPPAG